MVSYIRRGQIHYVRLGKNRGSEVNKTRPCLVVQNNIGNKYSPTTIVVPISHKNLKKLHPTQIKLKEWMQEDKVSILDGVIMAEQIRAVDKSRIGDFVGKLSPRAMRLVEQAMLVSVGVNNE